MSKAGAQWIEAHRNVDLRGMSERTVVLECGHTRSRTIARIGARMACTRCPRKSNGGCRLVQIVADATEEE